MPRHKWMYKSEYRKFDTFPHSERSQGIRKTTQRTNDQLYTNNKTPVVDFHSDFFDGQIQLAYLRDRKCSPKEVINFFYLFDKEDISTVYVTVKENDRVDDDSVLAVYADSRTYLIPINYFWYGLPQDVRNMFKGAWSLYETYQKLFTYYDIELKTFPVSGKGKNQ